MVGKKWRIVTLSDVVWIVPRGNRGGVPEDASPVSPSLSAWLVEGWLPDEPRSRSIVAEIASFLAGPLGDRSDSSFVSQRSAVRRALTSGQLAAYRMEMEFLLTPVKKKEEQKGERVAPREEKTWFGIELVDDDDPPKPVAFKRYRIELPSGEVREGMLDQNGQARVTGIDPGSCKVSFPDLHGEDWRRL